MGQPLSSISGLDAGKLLRDAFAIEEGTAGWVDYNIVNPVSGKVEAKTSYIDHSQRDMVIGCGIYKAI